MRHALLWIAALLLVAAAPAARGAEPKPPIWMNSPEHRENILSDKTRFQGGAADHTPEGEDHEEWHEVHRGLL